MKKIIFFYFILSNCIGQKSTIDTLEVKLISQKGRNLCWASSMEMIIKAIDVKSIVSQKDIVKKLGIDCCMCECNKNCNDSQNCKSCDIEFAAEANRYDKLFKLLDIQSIQKDSTVLSKDKIISEIKNKRPILIAVRLNENTNSILPNYKANHTVVISGYFENKGKMIIKIKDPFQQCKGQLREIDYDTFFKDYKTTFVTNFVKVQ